MLKMEQEAMDILNAEKPIQAKQIGDKLNGCPNIADWESRKVTIMRSMLDLKFHSCKEFRDRIQDSGDKILVEGTAHKFCASGLPPRATASQPIDVWPGENRLGKLLMEIRAVKLRGHSPDTHEPSVSRSEAFQIAEALITKALNPNENEISSPDLIMKADSVILASQQEPSTMKHSFMSMFKNKLSPKTSKRKVISPVSASEQPENKRPAKDTHKSTSKKSKNKNKGVEITHKPP